MSSSAGSPSATSAASPPNLTPAPALLSRPSLCMKPFPTAASPSVGVTSPPATLTSKEWIVPPRPKPGRKPATDTPPTKRKAQNRAAQRAFRERRAARVGELEEQIKQIEDEHEMSQDELKSTIVQLEQEVERYKKDLTTWIDRCRQLEKELTEAKSFNAPTNSSTIQRSGTAGGEVVGCGNCTLDTRCQCIDDAFNAMTGEAVDGEPSHSEKRTASPSGDRSDKRIKAEPSDSMEIDFTAMYSKPAASRTRSHAVSPSSAVADPCGFCQDGTPCICAEMAAAEHEGDSAPRPLSPAASHRRAPRQLAQFTPPPSEGDVTNPLPLGTSGCTSGPGTCTQCQADPNSTLFCKSLAASRSQSVTESTGCCGGQGADGGCCRSQTASRATRSRPLANSRQLPPLLGSKSSITLTCADAYTTLSRHPAYERASGEIATWMPKLYANPSSAEGRPAMEIDAANVMAVLRDFDRRFGTDR